MTVSFRSSTGTRDFFLLLFLKGQIVNIWGSVGLQLLNSATID